MADKASAEQRKQTLEALEFEREGYVRRGLKDRASQVDAQIRALRGDVSPKPRTTRKA